MSTQGPRYTPTEMLAKLVGFDTVSHQSNLALIAFVEDYLAAHGIAATRVPNAQGDKASLYATIGPNVDGGVVLSAHSDVVPTAHQSWSSDPFTLTQRGSRLYGRGSTDMKGFLACALALVPEFAAAGLTRPIHLAISYDEEVGCVGCQDMIKQMADGAIAPPRGVIVGEPTEMQLVIAHKGINGYDTTVTGKEAHSSQTQLGANAIMAAGALIGELQRLADRARETAPADCPFTPPYTSFSVGTIEGGHALNIIPGSCHFAWECRTLPGEDPAQYVQALDRFARETVLPRLQATAPDATIETVPRAGAVALAPETGPNAAADGVPPDRRGAAEALARDLTGSNHTEVVSYATEGGVFQTHGFSTVVMGPGNIREAHQPDEFIEADELERCVRVLRGLIA
ncbi:acetylornithine deacetylase [Rhodovibrio salinarum]|uniref:Acetylornithine deacetylase n=1 Tax=Rhodovibrio salinarum TaxID=1087 RepID=A0A934QLE6_9PROT|nr:acetylornithine deacetylase [Rhodovibrio salinarum]MBK1698897.1 acetylornithine deacetylase [Rhodovibrio salinarum]